MEIITNNESQVCWPTDSFINKERRQFHQQRRASLQIKCSVDSYLVTDFSEMLALSTLGVLK